MIRPGDKGPDVGKLHQALLEEGHALPAFELSSQFYGPGTKLAVLAFQRSHIGPDRKPLVDDGIVGPATQWALQSPGQSSAMSLYKAPGWRFEPQNIPPDLAEALTSAVSDIGRKESPDGSNDGPDLSKFNPQGNPWCALAVSTWLNSLPKGSPFGRLASCLKIYEWATKNQKFLDQWTAPKPGDLWLVLRSGGHGHVGLIVDSSPHGLLSTVEGNVGNAVRGVVRTRKTATAIIRAGI